MGGGGRGFQAATAPLEEPPPRPCGQRLMVPCARQVGSRVRLLQASPSASPPRGLLTTGTSGTPIDSYRARGRLPITKPGRGSVEILRISSAWKFRNGA